MIETIEKLITCDLQNTNKFQLSTVLSLMSSYLRDIRDTELGHRRLLKRLYSLLENNPDTQGYSLGIKGVKGYIYTLMEWIECALENNRQRGKLMSDINKTESDFSERDSVDMSLQSNVHFLFKRTYNQRTCRHM